MRRLPRVFCTLPLPTENAIGTNALQKLKEKVDLDMYEHDVSIPRAELLRRTSGCSGLMCLLTEKVDRELIDAAGSELKVVSTVSVGFDHISVEECRKRGIRIGHTPDVLTEATAETAVALLLVTTRQFQTGIKYVKDGTWAGVTWRPGWLVQQGIENSVVGICGLGRIGVSIAAKLNRFKPAKILYTARSQKPEAEAEIGGATYCQDLKDMLSECDHLVVSCAMTDATRHLINAEALAAMKPSACLVNISRGGIVDQNALYTALSTGKLRAAGLDVCDPEPMLPDHPLLKLPNFVMFPHVGSATLQARNGMFDLAVDNLLAGLDDCQMPAELKA